MYYTKGFCSNVNRLRKNVYIIIIIAAFIFLWIISDIHLYLNFPLLLLFLVPLWIFFRIHRTNKKRALRWKRELIMNLFFLYLLAILYVTLHPFHFSPPGLNGNINLIPYVQMHYQYQYKPPFFWIIYTLGNIIMFLPFGFLFPMLHNKRFRLLITISLATLCSLLIETTQYFFTDDRAADIDDLLLNIIGSIFGYLLFILWNKLKKTLSVEIILFNQNK